MTGLPLSVLRQTGAGTRIEGIVQGPNYQERGPTPSSLAI